MEERYLLMAAERANHPVKVMARLLEVSRQGSCRWPSGVPDPAPWARHRQAILAAWEEGRRVFGARQVLHSLPAGFGGTTQYRVRRLMRDLGIRGVVPHARKRATIPDEGAPTRPDLVRRDFTSPVPAHRSVVDITYLRTGEGRPCLATVVDLATRMVVGWAMAPRMNADMVVSALEVARDHNARLSVGC